MSSGASMPYVNNQGIKIHYEVNGKGDPLLLVHGMFVNCKLWQDIGFVRALQDSYRLVMIDVRGHGMSDKPHDPALYEIGMLVSDLVRVLDELNIRKADPGQKNQHARRPNHNSISHISLCLECHLVAGNLLPRRFELNRPNKINNLALIPPFLPNSEM